MAEPAQHNPTFWSRFADWPAARQLAVLALLALVLALPSVLLDHDPGVDLSNWYAPMMRELAAGNWAGAFHPRTPPLFVLSGAALVGLGLAPFLAAKLASALWFVVGVWPVYGLQRLIFGPRLALLAAVLYVFCSRLQRYATEGIKESAKVTLLAALAWAALAAWRRPTAWRLLAMGLAGAALTLVWSGGSVVAALLGLALLWRDLRGGAAGAMAPRWRWPWRSLAAALLALGVLTPWLIYVTQTTGLPLAEARHAEVLRRLGAEPLLAAIQQPASLPADPTLELEAVNRAGLPPVTRRPGRSAWEDALLNGLYPPFLIFFLPVIVWRLWRRQVAGLEWGLLILAGAYLLLVFTGLGWFTKRYVIAVLPLLLGWAAIGFSQTGAWLIRHGWPRAPLLLAGLLAAALVWDGSKPAWPPESPRHQAMIDSVYACAAWLRQHGPAAVPPEAQPLRSTALYYHSGRLPVILADDPAVAMLAECDLFPPRQLRLHLPALLFMAQAKQVSFIVWDEELVKRCPALADLDALPPELTLAFDDRGRGRGGKAILRLTMPQPAWPPPSPGVPQDDPL